MWCIHRKGVNLAHARLRHILVNTVHVYNREDQSKYSQLKEKYISAMSYFEIKHCISKKQHTFHLPFQKTRMIWNFGRNTSVYIGFQCKWWRSERPIVGHRKQVILHGLSTVGKIVTNMLFYFFNIWWNQRQNKSQ